MFTDGLDSKAVRWVKELNRGDGYHMQGNGGDRKHMDYRPPIRSIFDQVRSDTNGIRNVGLPPTKLRSLVHLTREDADESGIGSETEVATDSEDDTYGGRYSLDSSPQDERQWYHKYHRGNNLHPGTLPRQQVRHDEHMFSETNSSVNTIRSHPGSNLPRQQAQPDEHLYSDSNSSVQASRPHYASNLSRQKTHPDEHLYSDTKSSVNPSRLRSTSNLDAHAVERPGLRADERQDLHCENTEYDSSDSDGTIEYAANEKKTKFVSPRNIYNVESSSPLSRPKIVVQGAVKARTPIDNLQEPEVPSAPPIYSSKKETDHATNPKLASVLHGVEANKMKEWPSATVKSCSSKKEDLGTTPSDKKESKEADPHVSTSSGDGARNSSFNTIPARVPTFHVSSQGPWQAMIAYDACVRLCLHSWARGCMEAPYFLEEECAILRNAFGLQQILLQSEEELLAKRSTDVAPEGAARKPKKVVGKLKVQVRKVKMVLDMPKGCSFSSLKPSTAQMESLKWRAARWQSSISAGWDALRNVRVSPRLNTSNSFSRNSLAYVQASTRYIKQVSSLLKVGVTTLRSSSSYDPVQESYSCLMRLKSSAEEEAIRMQPGSNEAHVFFPESPTDDLIIEVSDSKGAVHGRVVAQVAAVIDDPNDKLRWWSIYCEPEHELVGRLQLYVTYTVTDENNPTKCGLVAETVAYDLALEVAMKVQHFQQRNLLLHGSWKWLLGEFASYYGISDTYTKLRYLSYVMDVATPTADCLNLVHDLLVPVVKSRDENNLSRQEKRILGEIEEQIEHLLATVFENYKSLDESSPSGLVDIVRRASGLPAPGLVPAVKLYTLLHDILLPETQLAFCAYFQVATKKRSRRHMIDTDEFVAVNNEGCLVDLVTLSTAYSKMKMLCINIRHEVCTDIEIHNHHILPSFVDLPNVSASIYSVELCSRLRAFLVSCPPTGPSPHVAELVIATSDFQRDLANWNISPVKGGVDAKELFHLYIVLWIEDKRHLLLESCKLDKVKWSGVKTQHCTTPFVDDMYERLKDTLSEYEVIVCRWPEYTFVLENAVADIEKALMEALEKQYSDVLAPLKDILTPKKFGLKYVQKLAKRNSLAPYSVPEDLGVFLNTIKRLLDILRPKLETQLKSWFACIPDGGNHVAGERLSENTVMFRSKFRNYLQAIVEKFAENTRLQNATKLKKVIQDSKDAVGESEIRERMLPLIAQLTETMNQLHSVFESHVFVSICRGYWDRMGQDILSFLENRKENRSWYKASRVTVTVLDDTFASHMQRLQGHALLDKDLEPPRSVMEVRSSLCKDAANLKNSNYFYY